MHTVQLFPVFFISALALQACVSSPRQNEPSSPTNQNQQQKQAPAPADQAAAAPQKTPTPPAKKWARYQGNCKMMNPPGASEQLFSPCNKVALMVIYRKNKQPIVSLVRTEEDGRFSVEVPDRSPWTLSSALQGWRAEVEISKDSAQSAEISVILKPKNSS
jgi:hypothetical protein